MVLKQFLDGKVDLQERMQRLELKVEALFECCMVP